MRIQRKKTYISALINLNVAKFCVEKNVKKLFYSSSACIYPEHNQLDPNNPNCEESSAYPANPDSEYGWEKLFSERMFLSFNRNYNLNIRIARFHNIFGPMGNELIPFKSKDDANAFLRTHFGKKILTFNQVSEKIVYDLDK